MPRTIKQANDEADKAGRSSVQMSAVWNAIKTLTITTLVAGLVWLFAEAETLREKDVDIVLLVQTKPLPVGTDLSGTLLVDVLNGGAQAGVARGSPAIPAPGAATLSTPSGSALTASQARDINVRVRLQGGSLKMDQAERTLTELPIVLVLGDVGVPASTGEHTIDLMAALRAHSQFRTLGVSLQAVDPPIVSILVDEYMTRELPVRVLPPPDAQALELASAPIVSPPRVRVTLPTRDAARLGTDAGVDAPLNRSDFDRLTPGTPATLTGVRLKLAQPSQQTPAIAPWRVALTPPAADITLTVRTRSAEFVLPRVPIDVRLPASEMGRWSVTIPPDDQHMTDVTVIGPAELIDQVRDGRLQLRATLALSFDELARGITSKDAVLNEVSGLRAEVGNSRVRLEIRALGPG